MLYWAASETPPAEESLRRLRSSDLVILLVAHRYGTVRPPSLKSVTELEIDEAVRRGIPILAFVVDPAHPWPPDQIDTDPGTRELLAQFTGKVRDWVVVNTFSSPESLELAITRALAVYVSRHRQADLPPYARQRMVEVSRPESLRFAPDAVIQIGQAPDGAPLLVLVDRSISFENELDGIAAKLRRHADAPIIGEIRSQLNQAAADLAAKHGIHQGEVEGKDATFYVPEETLTELMPPSLFPLILTEMRMGRSFRSARPDISSPAVMRLAVRNSPSSEKATHYRPVQEVTRDPDLFRDSVPSLNASTIIPPFEPRPAAPSAPPPPSAHFRPRWRRGRKELEEGQSGESAAPPPPYAVSGPSAPFAPPPPYAVSAPSAPSAPLAPPPPYAPSGPSALFAPSAPSTPFAPIPDLYVPNPYSGTLDPAAPTSPGLAGQEAERVFSYAGRNRFLCVSLDTTPVAWSGGWSGGLGSWSAEPRLVIGRRFIEEGLERLHGVRYVLEAPYPAGALVDTAQQEPFRRKRADSLATMDAYLLDRLTHKIIVPRSAVMDFVLEVVDEAADLHARGRVHGDIKPNNILLSRGDVTLIDNGELSVGDVSHTVTLDWSPAEQLLLQPISFTADVHCLGLLLLHVLDASLLGREATYRLPGGEVARVLDNPVVYISPYNDSVPEATRRHWCDLIEKALRTDPGERWPSAREMGDAMRDILRVANLSGSVEVTEPLRYESALIEGENGDLLAAWVIAGQNHRKNTEDPPPVTFTPSS